MLDKATWHLSHPPFPFVWVPTRADPLKRVRLWFWDNCERRRLPDGSWEYREISKELREWLHLERSI
ncbi:MAG: hypothetical protein J0H17_08170 [Rhizobiales bacterium]|nr:hypothetical protein [Hyphomicrobiales bacterium]